MDEGEPHLLVVDDDARLRELLRRYLTDQGFRVTTAGDAAEARAKLASFAFDLARARRHDAGRERLRPDPQRCAATSRVPILLLTAMAEPEDRINGLERGADDYLVKPFEPRELVLRIRNILQRVPQPRRRIATRSASAPAASIWRAASCYRGDDPVHLTAAETGAARRAGAARAGEAVSREELSSEAQFSGNVRTVDVQMTRLRRKIERDPQFPRYLQTVRGTGYVLKPD